MLDTEFTPWPSFSEREIASVQATLTSNRVNYWTGTQCRDFEKAFARQMDSNYAIGVFNGTVAIELALRALEIGVGDEVVVTPRSFIASASTVSLLGATPVFADVDLDSQNMTASTIREVITSSTKAILLVHLAGCPAEMDEIMQLAAEHNIYVIEDCSQAHGARYKGKSVGSIGHIGTWSFCQDKIMTTGGEGGMVTTNSKDLWNKMWSFKDHGKNWSEVYEKDHPPGFRWLHKDFGNNFRMMEIQAAIGNIQLESLNAWSKRRNSIANRIWNVAREYPCFRVAAVPSQHHHAAYRAYVFVEQESLSKGWSRDVIMSEITRAGVPVYTGSCSEIYLEEAFKKARPSPSGKVEECERVGRDKYVFLMPPYANRSGN